MIRSKSNVAPYAASANAEILVLGVPPSKTYRLLEVKLPATSVNVCIITIKLNGVEKMQLIPSPSDNAYVVDEDLPGGSGLTAEIAIITAGTPIIGVTFLFDDGE